MVKKILIIIAVWFLIVIIFTFILTGLEEKSDQDQELRISEINKKVEQLIEEKNRENNQLTQQEKNNEYDQRRESENIIEEFDSLIDSINAEEIFEE